MNVQDQYYAISKCCNYKAYRDMQTVEDLILKRPVHYVCKNCNEHCQVDLVPVWKEVSKGIYRKETT